jgi:bacterioferritin-associated ferredoxin
MFVCVCNAVTDRQIRSQSECSRHGTVAEIYRALGVRVQCGKCVPAAKSIINGQRLQALDAASIRAFGGMQMPAGDSASIPACAMAD